MRFVRLNILLLLIICSLKAALLGQANQPVNNPALTAPALRSPLTGPGTVPVTTYQSGLRRSISPINNNAELVMSGHAGGGKHFRGVLPYNSDSEFGITSPASNIDSFLRYTTISDDYYRGGITPYYSYTSTVTRMAPGSNKVIVPPSPKIRGVGLDSAADLQKSGYRQNYNIDTRAASLDREHFTPMGLTPPKEVLAEELKYQEGPQLPSQDYQKQLEEFNKELRQASEKVDNLQRQLNVESQMVDLKKPSPDVWQSDSKEQALYEQQTQQDSLTKESESQQPSSAGKTDVYTKMMQEYQDLNKSYEDIFGQTIEERAAEGKKLEQPSGLIEERKLTYKASQRITGKSSPQESVSDDERGVQGELLESEARNVLSEHKTFASFAEDKFNQYLRAAETYMKEGKFYLASEAYTMASIYKPEDPLAYAGKSHALFAAGEYISSALYLAKAIEMFPGYVDFKVDIVSMIGDADTVEKRITDINQWLVASGAPELNFLLAYVNMQLGRLEKANEAIAAADERMPDLAAVKILQQAIEKRLGK